MTETEFLIGVILFFGGFFVAPKRPLLGIIISSIGAAMLQ